METINNFKYEKKFKDTMSTRGVQMYDDDFSPERVMYINLWEGDQYVGRLCISETNRKFTMTDISASGSKWMKETSRSVPAR